MNARVLQYWEAAKIKKATVVYQKSICQSYEDLSRLDHFKDAKIVELERLSTTEGKLGSFGGLLSGVSNRLLLCDCLSYSQMQSYKRSSTYLQNDARE